MIERCVKTIDLFNGLNDQDQMIEMGGSLFHKSCKSQMVGIIKNGAVVGMKCELCNFQAIVVPIKEKENQLC